jgi:hypothetical protein
MLLVLHPCRNDRSSRRLRFVVGRCWSLAALALVARRGVSPRLFRPGRPSFPCHNALEPVERLQRFARAQCVRVYSRECVAQRILFRLLGLCSGREER